MNDKAKSGSDSRHQRYSVGYGNNREVVAQKVYLVDAFRFDFEQSTVEEI